MKLEIKTEDAVYSFPQPRISHWGLVKKWSNDIDKWGFLIALVTECPLEVANSLSREVQGLLLTKFIDQFEHRKPNQVDWSKSTFGRFVDLDLWLSLGLEEHMAQVCEVLFDDPDPLFSEAFDTCLAAAQWRADVYRQFDEFFGLSEYEKAIERGVKFEDKQPTQQSLQLAWYETIQLVANEDLQMSDWVVNQPYVKVLNWLTWKKWKIEQQMLELNKPKAK